MGSVCLEPGAVAELVNDDFVGGKILSVGTSPDEDVLGQEEGGLGQLVAVQAVLEVADGRDGEDKMPVAEPLEDGRPEGDDILDGEALAAELPRRMLVAVRDDDVPLQMAEHPCRAEGDDDGPGPAEGLGGLGKGGIGMLQELFGSLPCEGAVMVE